MGRLTIIILTKNEAKHITAAILNARQCTDDILIVDSGSTDATVDLALKAGARVVFREWDDDFAAQRNFGLTQTTAEWVLYLDADERLDEAICQDIKAVIHGNDANNQYGIKRYMLFNTYRFHHGIFAPDVVWRLFPREAVQWVGKVHERPECLLSQKMLTGKMDHYTYDSWHQWLEKADHYTTIWARERYENGKRISLSSAFSHAFLGGMRALILKGAFLDGWMGILSCGQHAFYTMLKYAKLHELQVQGKWMKK